MSGGCASSLTWLLSFLLVVSSFLSFQCSATTIADEVAALIELKRGFENGEVELYDWREGSQSSCLWRGVICDNVTFLVTTLNLSMLSLTGEISPSIGNLHSLQHLDLSENNISGQIPAEISNCVSLVYLNFSWNNLTGEIPYLMSQLQQLELLSLGNNHLTGPIPSTFSSLINLRHLPWAWLGIHGSNEELHSQDCDFVVQSP